MDVNKSIYIEGQSKESHKWEDAAAWLDKYDHPLWKSMDRMLPAQDMVAWTGLF
ncbi:MAG: hypothetical protein WDN75_04220 [Bacteroidota bacterium]